jgi:hypothetical protein
MGKAAGEGGMTATKMIPWSTARALLAILVLLSGLAATTAPADRYFGKLKMSALRIRYETMQLKKRYEIHELLPDQAEHLLLLTEDAFLDWVRLYPKDPWLPSTAYNMAQLYEELPGTLARDHAVALLVFVKSHFPSTPYARQSRDQLHRGIRTRPVPVWANAPAVASPAASAPGVAATAAPSPSATPYRRLRSTGAR